MNTLTKVLLGKKEHMFTRLGHLLGTRRNRLVSRLILGAVIVTSCILLVEDAFRSAAPAASRPRLPPPVSASAALSRRAGAADGVFSRLQALLETPAGPACRHRHRLGGRCFSCQIGSESVVGQLDGLKPICLDWLPRNCCVLSFGINNDFSFDDAMADLGCSVHAFDPTMSRPSHRRSELVFFHNVGVAARDGQMAGLPVVSLATAARLAGRQTGVIDYLKLDVEGSEWELLLEEDSISELSRVTQLAVEFHTLNLVNSLLTDGVHVQQTVPDRRVTAEQARQMIAAVRALQAAGFELTDTVHGVACQKYAGGCLPFIYETAWVNTRLISDTVKSIHS